MRKISNISELVGQTFSKVYVVDSDAFHDDQLIFEKSNGDKYAFYHEQECCESVLLKEIVGELSDLENSPILIAYENFSSEDNDNGSLLWTFYKFATQKGYVDVSWYGESNGHYSESVNMYRYF